VLAFLDFFESVVVEHQELGGVQALYQFIFLLALVTAVVVFVVDCLLFVD